MEDKIYFGQLIDIYGDFLTENQRDIMKSFYDYDLSLGEIANNLGISRQAVSDSKHKAEVSLKEFEEKLGLSELKTALIKLENEGDLPETAAKRIRALADSIGG